MNHMSLMEQYATIREQHPDAIILFQKGIFFQMYYYDAVLASEILNLKIIWCKLNGENVPVCGVPVVALEKYESILAGKGYRVVVCRQEEDRGCVNRPADHITEPSGKPVRGYGQKWREYMSARQEQSQQVHKEENNGLTEGQMKVVNEILKIKPYHITPMEALMKVCEWNEMLKEQTE